MNKFIDLQFKKDKTLIGFDILSFEELYAQNDNQLLASKKRLGFYEIIFISEGEGTHFVDFDTFHLKQNDILFIGKNQVHAWPNKLTYQGYVLLFTERFLYENQIQFGDLAYDYPFNFVIYDPKTSILDKALFQTFMGLIELIRMEYALVKNRIRQELLQTLLRTFIVKVQSQLPLVEKHSDRSTKEQFIKLQKTIDQNIEHTRNAADYVNILGTTYHQLNSIVKQYTHTSLKTFIDKTLMLNAKRLLCDRENNISEVAFMLGFEESTNFTKFFKKHSSQTPKQFRDSLLK